MAARYFFHFSDSELMPDMEGMVLSDVAAAHLAAVDILAERLKGEGARFWCTMHWELKVTDATGAIVLVLSTIGKTVAAG